MEPKNHYASLEALIAQDAQANQYFNALPQYVQETMWERAGRINSFESLCHYADNLTKGDD